MKIVSWGGLFLVSFLAGHFMANPWMFPVGKILLFIKIYLMTLLTVVFLQQFVPYVWRIGQAWLTDLRCTTGIEEPKMAGGMQFSFAAAGLPNVQEKRPKNTDLRNVVVKPSISQKQEDEAPVTLNVLRATATVATKTKEVRRESDAGRKLVLLPPVKAVPETNAELVPINPASRPEEAMLKSTDETFMTNAGPIDEEIMMPESEVSATENVVRAEQNNFYSNENNDTIADLTVSYQEAAATIDDIEEVDNVDDASLGDIVTNDIMAAVVVEQIPQANWLCSAAPVLEEFFAVDATGIVAELSTEPEQITSTVGEVDDDKQAEYALEGIAIAAFSLIAPMGGMANEIADQVAFADAAAAEKFQIVEIVASETALLATEESIDPGFTAAEPIGDAVGGTGSEESGLVEEQRPEDDLPVDDPLESEFECIHVETTDARSGLDCYETVELDATEPTVCVASSLDTVALAEIEPDTTGQAESAEAPQTIVTTPKNMTTGSPSLHTYSCRLRCQKPGGLFRGPILSFYCRFVCQHGNY